MADGQRQRDPPNVEAEPQTPDTTVWVPDFGLTCGPPLQGSASHVFLQCSGVVGAMPETAEIEISTQEYNLAGGVTRLGFHVTASAGWDPAAVVIKDGNGNPVATLLSTADVGGGKASLILAQLGYGTYTISVGGAGDLPGDVTMSVFLVGDGNGDGAVNMADMTALRGLLGVKVGDARYRLEWDADLDGDLDTADYLQCRYNLNDSVNLLFQPLMLGALLHPNELYWNAVPCGRRWRWSRRFVERSGSRSAHCRPARHKMPPIGLGGRVCASPHARFSERSRLAKNS